MFDVATFPRINKPPRAPSNVYDLILKLTEYKSQDRPSISQALNSLNVE